MTEGPWPVRSSLVVFLGAPPASTCPLDFFYRRAATAPQRSRVTTQGAQGEMFADAPAVVGLALPLSR